MNTFKKQGKTSGTGHSSDGEAANPSVSLTTSVPLAVNEDKNDTDSTPVEPASNFDASSNNDNNSITIALNDSTHFDPLLSSDHGHLQELETLFKSTYSKPSTSEDTNVFSAQISASNDDISDLKSMIADLGKTLLAKMNTIESKIDNHCDQTRKIHDILTKSVLPSLLDLTDIIQETTESKVDERVRTKLEHIQTRIRTTQQPNEMKDLMDI